MKSTKNNKKKLSFPLKVLIVLIVLVTMFICSTILSDTDGTSTANSGTETNAVPQDTIILVDSDSIKATYLGASDASSLGVFYVTLKIENKTETEVVVNLESADVDGETIPLITTGVPLVIRPGNSGQASFIFSMVNLSISTMEEAERATFKIVARDNDSFDTLFESELITVDLH